MKEEAAGQTESQGMQGADIGNANEATTMRARVHQRGRECRQLGRDCEETDAVRANVLNRNGRRERKKTTNSLTVNGWKRSPRNVKWPYSTTCNIIAVDKPGFRKYGNEG